MPLHFADEGGKIPDKAKEIWEANKGITYKYKCGHSITFIPENFTTYNPPDCNLPCPNCLTNNSNNQLLPIMDIKLTDIKRIKPLRKVSEKKLKELINDIKINGQLNPVIVKKNKEGKYILIDGYYRCKAIELLELETINVVIKELEK